MSLCPPVRFLGSTLALLVGVGTPDMAWAQGTASTASAAGAGELLGRGRKVLLGVERITGVVGWYTRSEIEHDFGRFERRRRGGQLHFLAASAHAGDGRDTVNFSGVPRIALDYLTGLGMTLGGFASVLGSTGIEDLTIDGAQQEDITFPDVVTVLGGVRIGYVIALGRSVAFWPRVGLAYSMQSIYGSAGARQTLHAFQLNLEPTFLWSPVPHVGFLIHPIVDVGVGGRVDSSFVITGLPTQGSRGSFRAHATGVTTGLVVFF